MTLNIKHEISYDIPNDFPNYNHKNSIPLLTAYGCVLLERDTGRYYIYTAVNINTHEREVIYRRRTSLTTSAVDMIVEKIRLSKVAGEGKLQADRPLKNKMSLENIRELMDVTFNKVLPQFGYTIRKEQIALSYHILNAISNRQISLSEAAVGTGKTLAYLLPAIFAKRGMLNGYLNMSFFTGTPMVDISQMPIVIATSSIALQKAILSDLKKLSDILLKHKIIKTPLTAVIRKGREHYICERNLRTFISFEKNPDTLILLNSLLEPSAPIDIAEIDGINAYMKKRISVPVRCETNCPYRESCAYIKFREQAQELDIDIQVCNHNYFLADVLQRAEDKRPLIPNYQCVVIDEAHKFLSAARSMYGTELSYLSLLKLNKLALSIKFMSDTEQDFIREATGILSNESVKLFRRLGEYALGDDNGEDTGRYKALIDCKNLQRLYNIYMITVELIDVITPAYVSDTGIGRKAQLLHELEMIKNQSAVFIDHSDHICWLEIDKNQDTRLCATPKRIDKLLYNDLWNKGIPTILSSGTLSVAGDFSRIKQTLGIKFMNPCRVVETSKPSPFDYFNKSMIYISENVPFPDQTNKDYILAVTNEIERLIYATHGHAAVLFTSYKAMDMVMEQLNGRNIPFPFFRLGKGSVREIDKFKESGNGVLFAAGALWEGIDIPGDALSLLIMVKLPFQVPDPISEYEKSLYSSFKQYQQEVLLPDAQIRAIQGQGRLHRLETDTGIFAILDMRMGKNGVYRDYFLNAFPECYVTSDIIDVSGFTVTQKPEEYFK